MVKAGLRQSERRRIEISVRLVRFTCTLIAIALLPPRQRQTKRVFVRQKLPLHLQDFIQQIGKKELRGMLEDLIEVPSYDVSPAYYSDWGNPREFTIGDMGTGECAGEVVSLAQFDLAAAERLVFETQLKMDDGDYGPADQLAYQAMLTAARALIKTEFLDVSEDPNTVVEEFRKRFYDNGVWI